MKTKFIKGYRLLLLTLLLYYVAGVMRTEGRNSLVKLISSTLLALGKISELFCARS